MGKCRQCGMCCKAIAMSYSKKEIAATWSEINGAFIIKNWKRISREQALEYNPNLASLMVEYAEEKNKTYWYTCKMLDKNNRCSIHSTRPPICSGYPWYEQEVDSKTYLYGEDCGYRIDQLTIAES